MAVFGTWIFASAMFQRLVVLNDCEPVRPLCWSAAEVMCWQLLLVCVDHSRVEFSSMLVSVLLYAACILC